MKELIIAPTRRKKVAAALQAIEKKGLLTPQMVISAAKSPKSPLHKYFEWDDKKAGGAWRLQQARQLIKKIKVEIQTRKEVLPSVNYYRISSSSKSPGYASVGELSTKTSESASMLRREFKQIEDSIHRIIETAKAVRQKKLLLNFFRRLEDIKETI